MIELGYISLFIWEKNVYAHTHTYVLSIHICICASLKHKFIISKLIIALSFHSVFKVRMGVLTKDTQ